LRRVRARADALQAALDAAAAALPALLEPLSAEQQEQHEREEKEKAEKEEEERKMREEKRTRWKERLKQKKEEKKARRVQKAQAARGLRHCKSELCVFIPYSRSLCQCFLVLRVFFLRLSSPPPSLFLCNVSLCLSSLFFFAVSFDVDVDAVLVRWGDDGGRCGGSGLPAGTPVPAGHNKRCRLLSRDKCAAMNTVFATTTSITCALGSGLPSFDPTSS
jgi:hypothetical protein